MTPEIDYAKMSYEPTVESLLKDRELQRKRNTALREELNGLYAVLEDALEYLANNHHCTEVVERDVVVKNKATQAAWSGGVGHAKRQLAELLLRQPHMVTALAKRRHFWAFDIDLARTLAGISPKENS